MALDEEYYEDFDSEDDEYLDDYDEDNDDVEYYEDEY